MKFNESAVEEWAKEFAKAKTAPMSLETLIVINTIMAYADEISQDRVMEDIFNPDVTAGGKVAHRIKARGFSYNITATALLVLDTQIKNWADVAMYAAYLQYVAAKEGYKTIDAKILVERIFPDVHFPSDTEKERLWRLQKIDKGDRERLGLSIDNTLDYSVCYKSLFKTEDNVK